VAAQPPDVDELGAWFVDSVGQQVGRLPAADYDRTDTLNSETTMLNATTALHRAHFSWLRADGSEIARMRLAYVITHGVTGRRISGLVVSALRVNDAPHTALALTTR
jgi:hypothetical protein